MDVCSAPSKTDRSAYMRAYQREWMRNRRKSYLAGKACLKCGGDRFLEIHHRDPEHKISNRIWSWTQAKRAEELAKCDVLCRACHLFITRATAQPSTPARSGFRGVRKSLKPNLKKPWQSSLSIEGKKVSLGYFRTPEEAAFAYDLKVIDVYGPLATTNFRLRLVSDQPPLNRQLELFAL